MLRQIQRLGNGTPFLKKTIATYASVAETLEIARQQKDAERTWIKTQEAKMVLKGLLTNPNPASSASVGKGSSLVELLHPTGISNVSEVGMRVISSLLTYPLTLAYALHHIHQEEVGSSSGPCEKESGNKRVTRLLIIGARAESTLPQVWWKWLLHGLPSSLSGHDVKLSFIGPDVSLDVGGEKKKTIEWGKNRLEMNPILSDDKNVLHDHPFFMDLLRSNDVFVVFNPGFGSQVLREKWDSTLRLLMMTRKPIICSAHCDYDLQRDLDRVKLISAEEDSQDLGETIEFFLSPRKNPYSSLKATVDENEEDDRAKIIYCNHSLYAFCSK